MRYLIVSLGALVLGLGYSSPASAQCPNGQCSPAVQRVSPPPGVTFGQLSRDDSTLTAADGTVYKRGKDGVYRKGEPGVGCCCTPYPCDCCGCCPGSKQKK